MNSPTLLRLVGWVVYTTFREAMASRLFVGTSLVTGVCILFCLGVRVRGPAPLPVERGEARMRLPLEEMQRLGSAGEGMDTAYSEVSLLFGAVRIPYRHYSEDAIVFLQVLLAGFVADTAGILLALIWTAGFLPGFLEPARAAVLLAKPTPRWALLAGQYLGVLAFLALHAVVFVIGTWLALGAATGVWAPLYLLCVPVMLLHFAVFFGVSAWLAVRTRSTTVCLVGSLAFWVACWCVNHSWHAARGNEAFGLTAAYWLLPKPADFSWLLFEVLGAGRYFGRLLDYSTLRDGGGLPLAASILTSLLFTLVVLALSVRRFARTEY